MPGHDLSGHDRSSMDAWRLAESDAGSSIICRQEGVVVELLQLHTADEEPELN